MNRDRNEMTAFGAHASGLAGLSAPVVDLVAGAIAGAADLVDGTLAAYRARRDRRRSLKALFALDDRLLADIGLSRDDLLDVANRGLGVDELNARRYAMWRPSSRETGNAEEITVRRGVAADEALDKAA